MNINENRQNKEFHEVTIFETKKTDYEEKEI